MVNLDFVKFCNWINYYILMGLLAERVADRRLLRLTLGSLTAGVLTSDVVGPSIKGTLQSGPLSPLLWNLMLDVLDKVWRSAVIASSVTPTTATSMCGCGRRVSGPWRE